MVKRLQLAALIGGDILALYQFCLNYVLWKRKRATDFPVCYINCSDPNQGWLGSDVC